MAKKLTDKEKSDKKFKSELKSFIIATLRIASFRWKPRNQAKIDARVQRGVYMCAMCNSEIKPDEVKLDHINPVIDITEGFVSWDSYIERMFPKAEGFQVLCEICNSSKTAIENEMRKSFRAKRKDMQKLDQGIDNDDEE